MSEIGEMCDVVGYDAGDVGGQKRIVSCACGDFCGNGGCAFPENGGLRCGWAAHARTRWSLGWTRCRGVEGPQTRWSLRRKLIRRHQTRWGQVAAAGQRSWKRCCHYRQSLDWGVRQSLGVVASA